jgi:hypothetical protein
VVVRWVVAVPIWRRRRRGAAALETVVVRGAVVAAIVGPLRVAPVVRRGAAPEDLG